MNGTPSTSETEIPGWYFNFLAAVIKQLPRPGELDQTTAEGWEKNQKGLKKVLATTLLPTHHEKTASQQGLADQPVLDPAALVKPREKFTKEPILVLTTTIPEDYDPATRLGSFGKKNRKKFYYYNDLITDENFAKVTHKLVPGKTYTVKIFGINSGESATSEECLEKYRAEKALYTGAQGASFVYEQHRDTLPKGKGYVSFDEKDTLPVAGGDRRVPYVDAHSDGDFDFRLGNFEGDWHGLHCLVCFCDEQSLEPSTLQK